MNYYVWVIYFIKNQYDNVSNELKAIDEYKDRHYHELMRV